MKTLSLIQQSIQLALTTYSQNRKRMFSIGLNFSLLAVILSFILAATVSSNIIKFSKSPFANADNWTNIFTNGSYDVCFMLVAESFLILSAALLGSSLLLNRDPLLKGSIKVLDAILSLKANVWIAYFLGLLIMTALCTFQAFGFLGSSYINLFENDALYNVLPLGYWLGSLIDLILNSINIILAMAISAIAFGLKLNKKSWTEHKHALYASGILFIFLCAGFYRFYFTFNQLILELLNIYIKPTYPIRKSIPTPNGCTSAARLLFALSP